MREQRRRRQNREEDFNDRGRSAVQRLDSIQDPGKRYLLRDCIGSGVCGDVYEAIDRQAGIVIALCSVYFLSSIYIYITYLRKTRIFFFYPFHPFITHVSYRKQKSGGEGAKAHSRIGIHDPRGVQNSSGLHVSSESAGFLWYIS